MQLIIQTKNFSIEYINLIISLIPKEYKIKLIDKPIDLNKLNGCYIFGTKYNESEEKMKLIFSNNLYLTHIICIDELLDKLKN
jgi:hypothetical protein